MKFTAIERAWNTMVTKHRQRPRRARKSAPTVEVVHVTDDLPAKGKSPKATSRAERTLADEDLGPDLDFA